jgi:protein gp37
MSTNSSIEWTDATWNVVTGCTKVTPGCDNCYAETFAERFRGVAGHHFEAGFDLTLRPERLGLPLKWRKPRRVFVNSMSDLFHKDVPVDFIAETFAVMAAAHQHTFQILTKRHGRMRSLLNSADFRTRVELESAVLAHEGVDVTTNNPWEVWPLPNVWLGISAEDQPRADLRVPALLDTPAAVRFISAEPLLGPIDLKQAVRTVGSERSHGLTASYVHAGGCCEQRFHGIDWVIVGGESGHGARPIHPDWARTLRDQCTAAGSSFFFKQWGEWGPAPWSVRIPEPAGGWKAADPDWLAAEKAKAEQRGATHDIRPSGHLYEPDHKTWSLERDPDGHYPGAVRRWGKKRAGRELDGRTWDEFPRAVRS